MIVLIRVEYHAHRTMADNIPIGVAISLLGTGVGGKKSYGRR